MKGGKNTEIREGEAKDCRNHKKKNKLRDRTSQGNTPVEGTHKGVDPLEVLRRE